MNDVRKKLAFEIGKLEVSGSEKRSGLVEIALQAYETARMDGLCHEGAWEVAVSAARQDAGRQAPGAGGPGTRRETPK